MVFNLRQRSMVFICKPKPSFVTRKRIRPTDPSEPGKTIKYESSGFAVSGKWIKKAFFMQIDMKTMNHGTGLILNTCV